MLVNRKCNQKVHNMILNLIKNAFPTTFSSYISEIKLLILPEEGTFRHDTSRTETSHIIASYTTYIKAIVINKVRQLCIDT